MASNFQISLNKNLKKKNKFKELTLYDCKNYYKTTVIKIM